MPRSSMLNVPYTGLPTVESKDRPAAWQRISVNADMFGAGSGRALQQLGSTIASVGDAFSTQADKNQAELDGIKAREIDTQVMKDYTTETAAYTLQNGEQAVNSSEAHEKRLLEIKENAIKSAGGNKSVERMVRSSVEGQYRRAWSTAFGHKTKETIRYADEVGDARTDAAQKQAQVTMDEEKLESSLSIIENETKEKQRRHNWSIEVTTNVVKEKQSTALTGYVSNMARHYPDRAQEYFDKYKDRMDPAGIKAAEKAISDGFAGIGAKAPGEEAKRGSGPPQLPVRRPIPPMPPPPAAPIAPGRPGGQRSEAAPGVQLASLITGTMSDAPQPRAQRLAEAQKGLVEQGNIDLDNRPVVKNEDGSISTERSFSRNFDGKEVLLPLIREDGKVMTEDEAVEHYKKTGKHLGVFETPEDADAYAKGLSKEQQRKYAPGSAQAPGTVSDAAPGYVASRSEVQNYIVQQARLRGIDPGTALRVYQSEGSTNWKSTVPGENSFGPYQLYTGGGLGNKFIEAGHGDPSDPKTWKENIEFALNNVVEGGWGPWNGAKKVGIVEKMGVANNARVIPVGKSAGMQLISTSEPVAGNDDDPGEPTPKTPIAGRTLGAYRKEISEGDLTAKAPAGSRVIEAQNVPGRIRALPPAPQLKSSFETAAEKAGVTIRITSGGQTANRDPAMKDRPGGWTGSLRHTDGNAADVDILDDNGKKLARNDPKRLKFLEEVAATGAGGIGSGYMDDPLKVHIGLTGGSGQVGVGLGVYSKESTPEEVAAIKRGLARLEAAGGPVAGPSVRGGYVRYAARTTGTVSDAPQPGFQPPSAAQRYAQATTTDAVSPFNGPITADTTEANIKARMKWIEDDARAKGHEPSYARSINADMQAEWQSLKRQKIETHALAFKTVEDAVYGKDGAGKPKTRDEIMQDPATKMQWDLLTNKEKDTFERQMIARNSVGENRPVTPEDMSRLDKLTVDAMNNPEVLRNVDLGEWPKGLRAKVVKLREDLLVNGLGGSRETKQLEAAMSNLDVGWQITRAGITDKNSEEYKAVQHAMLGELRLHNETSDKPPTKEDLKIMTNRILRTVVVPGRFYGTNEIRAFQQPLSAPQEKALVEEWNQRNPHDQVKEAAEIKPDARWHWRRKQEEIEKRRIRGGYPVWP